VKPDLKRFLKRDWRKNPTGHYKRWYFFSESHERKKKFESYISAIAKAVDSFAQKHDVQVAIFGMEALDLFPCQQLKKILETPAAVFSSRDYSGYQMTALLRNLSFLITSRYHARVLSMPAGVPSIAISMDERLYNLLAESNHLQDYYIDTDHPNLHTQLEQAMEKIWAQKEIVSRQILDTIPSYLIKLANMGMTFSKLVTENFPELPVPRTTDDWKNYLPPLNADLHQIINA
jgi:polysaccharide pyruvyl transferase WcaK-like protein